MKTTQLIAEHIVIGGLLLICIFVTVYISDNHFQTQVTTMASTFKDFTGLILAVFIITAYSAGFFINIIAELAFKILVFKKAERFCLIRHCGVDPERLKKDTQYPVDIDEMRHHLYTRTDNHNRLEYHKSTLRLARGISLASIFYFIFLIIYGKALVAIYVFIASLVFLFCYFYRVVWFTKSTYDSFQAITKKDSV